MYLSLSSLLSTTFTGTSTSSVDPSLYWIKTVPVVSPTLLTSGCLLQMNCFASVSWSASLIPDFASGTFPTSVSIACSTGFGSFLSA